MFESKSLFLVASAVCLVLVTGSQAVAQFPEVLNASEFDGSDGFTVIGNRTMEFGWFVAGIGDVNADGIDDIASGGPGVSFPLPDCGLFPEECPDCDPTTGAVNVLFGRPGIEGDGNWNLGERDGTLGFRIPGLSLNGEAGRVSAAGDFNADGIADFLVGEPNANPNGHFLAGRAYMIYGAAGIGQNGSLDPATLNGSNGFVIAGGFSSAGIGRRMTALGDFNGDGISDIALSSISADLPGRPNAGQVYILFGGSGAGASGTFVIPDALNPDVGIILNGISSNDYAGVSVAGAGDFNGDGVDDIAVVSSVELQPSAQGQVYVVYGGSDIGNSGVFELADIDGNNGFVINGPTSGAMSTIIGPATGVGDINADGFDDIAVAVNTSDDYVAVVFGGPSVAPDGVFCLEDLNGTNGFTVIREVGIASSIGIAAGADFNGDGVVDGLFKVFAQNIVFGSHNLGEESEIDVMQLDGRGGFTFIAGGFVRGRSSAGDINADGLQDFVVSLEHYAGTCEVGKVHVVFGRRMGDGDLDADVDFADFGRFQACFGDPPDGDVPDDCHPFDFDLDNDVDLEDFAAFDEVFGTGP